MYTFNMYLHFFRVKTLHLQFCFGRPFTAVLLGSSWCTAAASLLIRISDFTIGIFSCVGRLRRVIISDVANDLCLSLKLDVCQLYRVLNSFSVIHMYYVFLHCVGLWDGGLVGDTFYLHTPFSEKKILSGSAPVPPE